MSDGGAYFVKKISKSKKNELNFHRTGAHPVVAIAYLSFL
jgi:hypothetical protein